MHQGETRGYGKNQMNRDNPQPSPKVARLWMQFRDLMSVGRQRPKIKSVHTETWPDRGIVVRVQSCYKESFRGVVKTALGQTLAYSN